MSIALFHFHVTQIKHSAGQSAIASAAYRAGEKLHSEYYGEDNDYTRKGGVICSDILLPSHAPPEYADRETLWNAVEKAELAKPQPPILNDLLALHCANRNKGAYSNKAKNANLQRYAEAFSFLQSKNLYTVDDLENTLHAMQDKIDTLKKSASSKQARIKEVDELLRMVDYYKSGKPAADKLKSIRFEKSRQKYKSEHDNELRTFYMAERKLKPYFKDGKLPITAWRKERDRLEREYKTEQAELSPIHAEVKKLWQIKYKVEQVIHEQERQNAAVRQKKQEIEH